MITIKILWIICAFIICEAMILYPITLIVIDKIFNKKDNIKDLNYEPTVTIIVVAHNEEKVIRKKLKNILSINYPKAKLKTIVASDYSTDKTNDIVKEFIKQNRGFNICLYRSKKHYGKTNAQNEAQALVDSEILVMTDANSIFEDNAVRELVSSFSNQNIAYVTGQLKYVNTGNRTAQMENFYWKLDLICRDIESRFQSITAGNGAIYAVRNSEYVKIEPIECHDSSFPLIFSMKNKRAIYNRNAVAYEKAGEIDKDEFKRKVRMNRIIFKEIFPDLRILNIFKYGWFSYFYFGHRICRYLLWLMHSLVFILNIFLVKENIFWQITFLFQIIFYLASIFGIITNSKNKLLRVISYYCMTIIAQWKGVLNIISGKSNSIWEKAESTR